jgi:hypothetical protein
MSTALAALRPALLMRLQFIESLLAHYGHLNRSVLMDFFALSAPQATRDFRVYLELAPGNAVYDPAARVYLRGGGFARLWPVGDQSEQGTP